MFMNNAHNTCAQGTTPPIIKLPLKFAKSVLEFYDATKDVVFIVRESS